MFLANLTGGRPVGAITRARLREWEEMDEAVRHAAWLSEFMARRYVVDRR
jgi:hypothetical protein